MPSQWIHFIKPGERANTRGTIRAACGSNVFTSDAKMLDENYLITCSRCYLIAESFEVQNRMRVKD